MIGKQHAYPKVRQLTLESDYMHQENPRRLAWEPFLLADDKGLE